jgi:catechol-2,3-dioxygenase
MSTLPLGTDDLLKESKEKRWKNMAANTGIGHIHLHVKFIQSSEVLN